MNLIDIIIVVLLGVLIGVLIYFSFIKHRGDVCHNCLYHKSCGKSKCCQERKED